MIPSVGRFGMIVTSNTELAGYSSFKAERPIQPVTTKQETNPAGGYPPLDSFTLTHVHFAQDEGSGMRWFWPK